MTTPDETAAAGLRPLLFSIAYGMTGSVGDAEDIVQDAMLGLVKAQRAGTAVDNVKAYLTTTVTRLAINHLGSARVRRETYVGAWLPEPLVAPAGEQGPAEHAELADALSMAFLVMLEALSPVERAVFMLREVFGYGYPEVAALVGKSEANCRQIFTRARQRIPAPAPAPSTLTDHTPTRPVTNHPPTKPPVTDHAPAGQTTTNRAAARQTATDHPPASQTATDHALARQAVTSRAAAGQPFADHAPTSQTTANRAPARRTATDRTPMRQTVTGSALARKSEAAELADRFFAAASGGDIEALLALLAPDVIMIGDGGGKAQVFTTPPTGRLQVARLFAGLFRRFTKLGVTVSPAWVNGHPGALFHDPQNRIVAVMSLDLTDDTVHTIRSVVNPDKLHHLGPVSDLGLKPEPR